MNRRRNQRAKVDLLANRFLDGQPYVCRVTDLSLSGLRLVPLIEPQGQHRFMGLQLQLPGSSVVVTASAEAVVGSRDGGGGGGPAGASGTGARFTNLPPESESALREFLAAG